MAKAENVKNENYVNISGWMINDLDLKGNELIVYAIIYGFSQKEGQYFNGGFQYLADWINSSRQTVINIMKSLEERGLIVRVETGNSSGKSNSYYAVRNVVKKIDQSKNLASQKIVPDLVKKFDKGSQKTLLHNIDIINNTIEREEDEEKTAEEKKEIVTSGAYYQSVRMLLSEYKTINYESIARAGKPIERIKAVLEFAKKNGKGEGWIVGAIKYSYKLDDSYVKNSKKELEINKNPAYKVL